MKVHQVPLMYAHTSPYPCTHVSASRLSDHFAIYEARSCFFPRWKFIVVSGATNSRWKVERPVAAALDLSNTETAEPSGAEPTDRPLVLVKKGKRRYLALIKSSARKKCRESLDKASTATLTTGVVTSARRIRTKRGRGQIQDG